MLVDVPQVEPWSPDHDSKAVSRSMMVSIVLLLEAGGDGTLASTVPMLIPASLDTYDTPLTDSAIDWGYKGCRGRKEEGATITG